jgi:excisionase family DNA binding protein
MNDLYTAGKTLLSSRQVQEFLNISQPTLYRYLSTGVIPARKIGGAWKVDQEELELSLRCAPYTSQNRPNGKS